jgi:hypothetical protein
VCESMLKIEWKLASHWIPLYVSKYRWLVHHHLEQVHESLEYWLDKELDHQEEQESKAEDLKQKENGTHKFGPIPHISCVYEVTVCDVSNVF